MNNTKWILLMSLALALTSCGQEATVEPIPTIVLDTNTSNSNSAASSSSAAVIASAEVRPVESVNLSFPLLGTVKTVDVQVGDTVTTGQSIAALETAILEAQVAEFEANVAAAQAQLALLKRIGSKQDQLEGAQADVDRAQAIVAQAKVRLSQASLHTPIDGTVVSVGIAPGETANPGQVIITVANLSHMRIETTDLSERDILAVEIGQNAIVFIEALNDSFEGQVIDIDRQAETFGGDVTYKVTINLEDQPNGLRWGMSAEVGIHSEP